MKLSLANKITIIRILLIGPFVICMLKADETDYGTIIRYISLIIFLFMCISDALDGYFARVKKEVTRLGSFLDPLADKLLMTCACVLLASPGTAIRNFQLPPTIVVTIIGKDVVVSLGFAILYFITSEVYIVPVLAGKLSTFLQLSMVAAVLIGPEMLILWGGWYWFVRLLWWMAMAMAILAMLIYIVLGIRYYKEFEERMNSINQ